jgi:hypothetical protein
MSDNIRLVDFGKNKTPEADEGIVEQLEELVARAKSGEIRGIAYGAITGDASSFTGFALAKNTSRTLLIGAASHVLWRLNLMMENTPGVALDPVPEADETDPVKIEIAERSEKGEPHELQERVEENREEGRRVEEDR